MIDERLTLTPGLQQAVVQAAKIGAERAVKELFAQQQEEAAKALIDQQKAKTKTRLIGQGQVRTELYPIKVVHKGTAPGVDTEVSMDGVGRWFKIQQLGSRPARPNTAASQWGKLKFKPMWQVHLMEGQVPIMIEQTEDLEAAVQQCIVALLGHVYYGNR